MNKSEKAQILRESPPPKTLPLQTFKGAKRPTDGLQNSQFTVENSFPNSRTDPLKTDFLAHKFTHSTTLVLRVLHLSIINHMSHHRRIVQHQMSASVQFRPRAHGGEMVAEQMRILVSQQPSFDGIRWHWVRRVHVDDMCQSLHSFRHVQVTFRDCRSL